METRRFRINGRDEAVVVYDDVGHRFNVYLGSVSASAVELDLEVNLRSSPRQVSAHNELTRREVGVGSSLSLPLIPDIKNTVVAVNGESVLLDVTVPEEWTTDWESIPPDEDE